MAVHRRPAAARHEAAIRSLSTLITPEFRGLFFGVRVDSAELTASDGVEVGVAGEVVPGDFAENIGEEILDGEQAGKLGVFIDDDEEVTISAKKGGESLIDAVIFAEIVNMGVEEIFGAGSVFDFEGGERIGVKDTDDGAGIVQNGKMAEAGAVKSVEHERAEKIVFIEEGELRFWSHETFDGFSVSGHGGGNDLTFARGNDGLWSMAQ